MSTLAERMQARKRARDAGQPVPSMKDTAPPPVTTNKSVNNSLHPSEAPQIDSKDDKPNALESSNDIKKTADTPTVAVSAIGTGGAAGLLNKLRASEKPTVVTASDTLAKVKAMTSAAKAETTKPAPTVAPSASRMPSVRKTAPVMHNEAADMVNSYTNICTEEQSASISALEGLDAETFMEDILLLETYLTDDVPDIASLQQRTHQNLIQYPELAHILDDAQVGVIVQGYMKRKNIEVVTPSKGKGATNVKNMTRNMTKSQVMDLL